MGTFSNVSETNPCPICGKTDWCSFFIPDNPSYPGQVLCVCRRIQASEIKSHINGRTYFFIKEFPDASSLYTDNKCNSKYKEIPLRQKNSTISIMPSRNFKTITNQALPNEKLNKIYSKFLSLLELHPHDKTNLIKDGWSEELIRSSNIKSLFFKRVYDKEKNHYTDLPFRKEICNKLIAEFGDLTGVPGFYTNQDNHWTFVGKNGLLIPIYDQKQRIYRLRLRLAKPDIDEKGKVKNKYKNFSSFKEVQDENGNPSNLYQKGCRAGSHLGVYYHPSTDNPTICFITEGEKKAIVANYYFRAIVISVPGVNSYNKLLEPQEDMSCIEFLKSIKCKKTVIAYDADKSVNEAVKKCEARLIALLKENNFDTYTAEWNSGFGKGLDDILLTGIYPNLLPV